MQATGQDKRTTHIRPNEKCVRKGFFTRRSQPANGESARDGLHPRRKRVPSRRLADRQSNLLNKNQKRSCPERRPVELAPRPHIIGGQQKQKGIRSDSG